LPFATGAIIYFASKNKRIMEQFIKLRLSATNLYVVMLLNCLIFVIASRTNAGIVVEAGFYLNIAICALLVYSLAIGREIIGINRKIDKIIGDYSYPIYLLHWQSGLLASYLIFGEAFHEFSLRGFISLLFAFFIVVLLSTLFIRRLDDPIQGVRTKIKASKALQRTLNKRGEACTRYVISRLDT